ncbi:MAG TPA: tetratricopeptide repeat protein [Bacteroidota bacterium]
MIVRRCIIILFTLLSGTALLSAQLQETGAGDYALGNSSVMWLPTSSALFLNPGELARIHQNEFLVTSGRFHSLTAMSGAFFLPNAGSFGIGITPNGNLSEYSAGFGRLIGDYHTIGGAVSLLPETRGGVRFSLGGALHIPFEGKESGVHAGLSVTSLPRNAIVNLGAAYWVMPNILRIQFASRSKMERASFLGAAGTIVNGVQLQVGLRGFKNIAGGLSYATPYATMVVGGGPEGLLFSVNVRIGDAASDTRIDAYNQGNEAFADERYADAKNWFQTAIQYDEYDGEARGMAERSQHLVDSLVTSLLEEARESEAHRNFTDAIHAYAQVLKIDPQQSAVASQLAEVEKKVRVYVQQLLQAGDSLKAIRQLTRARQSYNLALELDPDNEIASSRIDELDNITKENVKAIISHAKSLVARNQLDDAQKEYERALSMEPGNVQAKSGLNAIKSRRFRDELAAGKAAYDARDYFKALLTFSKIVEEDRSNKDAQTYLEKTRDALKGQIPALFKIGLQFYIKEDYKSALAEWDKVLMIQPQDSSTLEYRKRAEEKMKALEQFK